MCVSSGARKRFRRPTTSAPSISSDQEVSASVNRFKVTRNRVSNKSTKNELQSGKTSDYKVSYVLTLNAPMTTTTMTMLIATEHALNYVSPTNELTNYTHSIVRHVSRREEPRRIIAATPRGMGFTFSLSVSVFAVP